MIVNIVLHLAISRYKTLDTEAVLRISSFGSKPYSSYIYVHFFIQQKRVSTVYSRVLDSKMKNHIYNHALHIYSAYLAPIANYISVLHFSLITV